MIEIVRREGREPILTGLSRQSASIPGRASTAQAIRRLASEMHVPFADWGAVRYTPDEMADILHPASNIRTGSYEASSKSWISWRLSARDVNIHANGTEQSAASGPQLAMPRLRAR